jgi:hypothetical protein
MYKNVGLSERQPYAQLHTTESMWCWREGPWRLVARDALVKTTHTVTIDSGPWTEGYRQSAWWKDNFRCSADFSTNNVDRQDKAHLRAQPTRLHWSLSLYPSNNTKLYIYQLDWQKQVMTSRIIDKSKRCIAVKRKGLNYTFTSKNEPNNQ